MRLTSCVIAILCLLTARVAVAQADRGTVTGTVTDQQAAVIPAAQVVLRNLATGIETKVQTTSAGNFSITSVPVGTYSLTVEQPGFQKFIQTGITVAVAQTARVDVRLAVGATSESVTVSADAPLLKTESAEHSTVVTPTDMNELPLKFSGAIRSPFDFIAITPGVYGTNSWDMKVNGSPVDKFRVLLDGQEAQSQLNIGIQTEIQPSVEALQEMTLQTSGFSAEYGQVGAGMLNMTTRSGGNRFHGTGYDIIANEAFNAGQPYSNDGANHHVRPRLRQHDWGFNLGGPVRIPRLYDGANRTFFFFNYEQFNEKLSWYRIVSVPSEAFRNGDFSWNLTGRNLATDGLGRPILEGVIYDPGTSRMVNGRVYRDPFVGNRVPVSLFDPMAVKIQNLLPTPNISVPGGVPQNNYDATQDGGRTQRVPSIKIDHNVTPSAKVSGIFTYNRTYFTSWTDGLPDPLSNRREFDINAYTVRVNYDHTLTPTLLNHFAVGHQHHQNGDSTPITDYDQMKELGLKGALAGGFPKITGAFVRMGPGTYNKWVMDKPTATEALTWVHGAHTSKFGGEYRIDAVSNIGKGSAVGTYAFSGAQTGLPATQGMSLGGGSIGYGYASFLMGLVDSSSIGTPTEPQWRRNSIGLYAQDSWKVSRNLTLEYGLRWDYQPAFHEIWYRTSIFDPNTPNPSAGGLKGATLYEGWGQGRCNCTIAQTYPWAFAPRLGLAYRIDSKTVLRAGWGLSYSQPTTLNRGIEGSEIIGFGWNTLNFGTPEYGAPVSRLQDGLNYNPATLFATNFDPGIRPSPGQLNSPPPHVDENGGRPPRMNSWSIGLQRELTKDLILEAAYVGNRGVWWTGNGAVDGLIDYNAIEPARLQAFGLDISKPADRTLLTSRLDSPLAQSRGFKAPYAGYPMSTTVAQSLRPFPQFGTLYSRMAPLGNTWYDSLQVKATKRYSHGFSFGVAYTWSKTLGTVDGAVNDFANRALAKSITTYDVPHNLTINGVWELPAFGMAKRNALTRLAFGGWKLGALLRYSSGLPIDTPAARNALSSLLFQGTKMNRVPGQPLFTNDPNCHSCWDPNKDFILNPNAWADAGPGEWGAAAPRYSDYRYARTPDEKFQVTKAFQVREGMSLNIRFELFNAFNRMRWPNPASGNPQATQRVGTNGVPISGFGFVNAIGSSGQRSGQLVVRFQF